MNYNMNINEKQESEIMKIILSNTQKEVRPDGEVVFVIPDIAIMAVDIMSHYNKNTRNGLKLQSFIDYMNQYPDERFWQALRNWSGSSFILKADSLDLSTGEFKGVKDTFYNE